MTTKEETFLEDQDQATKEQDAWDRQKAEIDKDHIESDARDWQERA